MSRHNTFLRVLETESNLLLQKSIYAICKIAGGQTSNASIVLQLNLIVSKAHCYFSHTEVNLISKDVFSTVISHTVHIEYNLNSMPLLFFYRYISMICKNTLRCHCGETFTTTTGCCCCCCRWHNVRGRHCKPVSAAAVHMW